MKTLKIYLFVVCMILVIAISLGVYVWYTLQKLDTAGVPIPTPTEIRSEDDTASTSEASGNSAHLA